MTALFHGASRPGGPGDVRQAELETLTARLQAQELALARVNRDYDRHLQVRRFAPNSVRAALPPRAALLELREYRPTDFHVHKHGLPRWAGLLLVEDRVRVVDLGPVADTAEAIRALPADIEGEVGRRAARRLHKQLLDPLAADLAGVEQLYIAPDGDLYLLSFAALLGPDGRRLVERFDLRMLQTGHDLLRPAPGLLALGGIDFDADAPASLGAGAAELRRHQAA